MTIARKGKRARPANLTALVPSEVIERRIYLVRGQKVMLDSDLAGLYQVETRALVQAVKRNPGRFPEDFMFQLSPKEAAAMRSQIVIASRRNARYQPYAFTEHGALMLSAVLKSKRATQVSLHIVRVFIQLREMLTSNKDLAQQVEKLRAEQQRHGQNIRRIFVILEEMLEPPTKPKRAIGFAAGENIP